MTGSGKTAAFVLPILHHLIDKPRGKTRALIVTPTRELAAQILTALDSMAVHTPITAAAIYGGVGMAPQEHAMRAGVDVLVAGAAEAVPGARVLPSIASHAVVEPILLAASFYRLANALAIGGGLGDSCLQSRNEPPTSA